MTREDASEILSDEEISCLIGKFHGAKEALDLALSALRPVAVGVEKVWRGEWEWYDEEVGSPLEGIEREWGWRCSKCKTVLPDEFDNPDDSPAMRFCQWCGAPMTDEAVEMVLERINEKEKMKK